MQAEEILCNSGDPCMPAYTVVIYDVRITAYASNMPSIALLLKQPKTDILGSQVFV